MALFQFTALRQGGEKYTGTREAETRQEVIDALKAEGSVALLVDPVRGRPGRKKFSFKMVLFERVKGSDKIIFARNLSAMIAAGLPLSRALAVLEKQTKSPALKKTLAAVGERIKQGDSLPEALAAFPKVFSPLFVAMTRAGAESGALPQALQTVATQMERSYELTRKVRGAMIYPAIVVTVMFGIGIMMLIYVVPTLAQTFASLNTDLPAPTRFIIATSNLFIQHGLLMAAAIAAFIFALVWAGRTGSGKKLIDRGLLYVPVVGGIVAKVNAARTARTLSSLLTSGVGALQALSITKDVVQNACFRPVIEEAHQAVEKGRPLSAAFVAAEKIYPVMFAEMAAVGEETGDLPGMLGRVAQFYEDEVEQQTKDLSTIIEPVLMVVIGGGVGFFAVAMIAPIYSLSSAIH